MAKTERLVLVEEPNTCASCSEQTTPLCGMRVKRWCLMLSALVAISIAAIVIAILYAVQVDQLTKCRLTYSNKAKISEAEMQQWAARDDWPLNTPQYDTWRRTCVCQGYEDVDPVNIQPTDEVLAWIAPIDLITLSMENKIDPLPQYFIDKYRFPSLKDKLCDIYKPKTAIVGLGSNPHSFECCCPKDYTCNSFWWGDGDIYGCCKTFSYDDGSADCSSDGMKNTDGSTRYYHLGGCDSSRPSC